MPSCRWSSTSSSAHLDPQLRVEIGEWLVHQEDLGAADEGASEGDPLALAPRELGGLASEEPGEPEALRHAGNDVVDVIAGDAARAEWELDVLADAQVRVQGVALEDHGDVAVLGDHPIHGRPTDADGAGGRCLEPSDEAQHRRLAAPRGAEQDEELPGSGIEGHVAERGHVTEPLGHPRELDGRRLCPGHRENRRVQGASGSLAQRLVRSHEEESLQRVAVGHRAERPWPGVQLLAGQ